MITGASGGIGAALAHELAAKKHNLLLVARSEQPLKTLCETLSAQHGIAAHYIVADLSQPGGAQQVFEATQQRNLSVEVLVNNAGRGSSGEFVHNDLQSELNMLQLNNASLIALCHYFLPGMIARKSGSIVNVGSLAAFFPSPYMAAYAASKMFVRSFTEALTEECRPHKVHVLLFNPGFTSSSFMDTPANNNNWGKVLTEGAYTQSAEQVAREMVRALEKQKNFHVSGRLNLLATKILALIPNRTVARLFANSKRKKMKL